MRWLLTRVGIDSKLLAGMCYRPIDPKLFLVGHPDLPRYHRPVIDGLKLLADALGNGV